MPYKEVIEVVFGGMIGSLIKDLVEDGCLTLPWKTDGKLSLGFIGGMIIGGAVGYVIDGNFITAFLAGYAGGSVIESLLKK